MITKQVKTHKVTPQPEETEYQVLVASDGRQFPLFKSGEAKCYDQALIAFRAVRHVPAPDNLLEELSIGDVRSTAFWVYPTTIEDIDKIHDFYFWKYIMQDDLNHRYKLITKIPLKTWTLIFRHWEDRKYNFPDKRIYAEQYDLVYDQLETNKRKLINLMSQLPKN